MVLSCYHCHTLVTNVDDQAVSVICGRCVQLIAAGKLAEQEAYLSRFSAEDCKAFRQGQGWTQAALAIKAGIPTSQVASFEQGHSVCPLEVATMLEAQA